MILGIDKNDYHNFQFYNASQPSLDRERLLH